MQKLIILDGITGNSSDGSRDQVVAAKIETLVCDKESLLLRNFKVSEMKVNTCNGCGACTNKTPGLCVYKDDGLDFTLHLSEANHWVIFTSVRYGAFEAGVKRVMDRIALLGSPYFELVEGNLFHKGRYDQTLEKFTVYVLNEGSSGSGGLEGSEQEVRQVFEKTVRRDAEHLHIKEVKIEWLDVR